MLNTAPYINKKCNRMLNTAPYTDKKMPLQTKQEVAENKKKKELLQIKKVDAWWMSWK